jgi:hypothetical protein
MGVISTSQIFGLTVRESADDGSDFTNPAADYRRLFLGEDGTLKLKDSAGTVTSIGGSGSVATDAIWDAAGDLAVGTGANTAAKLTIGANRTLLKSNGTTAAWAFPTAIGCAIVEATAQSITNTTPAALTSNDAEVLDTDAFHDTSSNTARISIVSGFSGWWFFAGTIFYAANGTGYRAAFFKVTGTTTEMGFTRVLSGSAGVGTYVTAAGIIGPLTGGTDYVELWADQASGGALNANLSAFRGVYLGV